MQNKLVSIIVPMYNSEKYIRECLLSIQHQSYRNFECIIVDDGSEDDSFTIANDFAKRDGRFRVVSQTHKGVSYALGSGVNVVKGAWIYFLDSDDWIDEDEIERLYDHVELQKCDMVVSDYIIETQVSSRMSIVRFDGIVEKNIYATYFYPQFLCDNHYNEIVCGNTRGAKLIRSDLVKNNIHFQLGLSFAEDAVLMLGILCDCTRVCSELSKAGYHYRKHEMSAMHNCDDKYIIYRAKYSQRVLKLYQEKGIADNLSIQRNYLHFNLFSIFSILKRVDFDLKRLEHQEGFGWIWDTLDMLSAKKKYLDFRNYILLWLLIHKKYRVLSLAYQVNHFLTYSLKTRK